MSKTETAFVRFVNSGGNRNVAPHIMNPRPAGPPATSARPRGSAAAVVVQYTCNSTTSTPPGADLFVMNSRTYRAGSTIKPQSLMSLGTMQVFSYGPSMI